MQYTERMNRYVYEDIGGKTDENDKSIDDTISREVIEETNNVITKEIIKEHLEKKHHKIYLKDCKYYVLLIEASDNIIKQEPRAYGKMEKNGKYRMFYWIDSIKLTTKGVPFNKRIWVLRKEITDFFSTL